MKYLNLTIIGTSHIARQSLQEVTATIEKEKPDIIALELDKRRFYALTHKVKRKVRLNRMIIVHREIISVVLLMKSGEKFLLSSKKILTITTRTKRIAMPAIINLIPFLRSLYIFFPFYF